MDKPQTTPALTGEELPTLLRYLYRDTPVVLQAADEIERLQKKIDEMEVRHAMYGTI